MKQLLPVIALIISSIGLAQSSTDKFIDNRKEVIVETAQKLWDLAELGYQEVQSAKHIISILKKNGFSITQGMGGIPTAFVGEFRQGKTGPVIAIMGEMDALPGITQAISSSRNKHPTKTAGQACGHNLFGAGSLGAVLAVKDWLENNKNIAGTIRFVGTPAEEGGSGKVYLTRAGVFDDVNIALHWHPGSSNTADARSSLANRSAKFRFSGVSSHAAGAPHKGRSALDGVEAFNFMINLMREHIEPTARIHYVITNGGAAPNVVPDFAEVFYYVRHPKAEELENMWLRVEKAALGAAQGTETTVKWEVIHGNHAILPNSALQKIIHKHLSQVPPPAYTEEEKHFARQIATTLTPPRETANLDWKVKPFTEDVTGSGSTDVGDVSMKVPTGGFYAMTYAPGTSNHSWQAIAQGGMSIGHKGAIIAAKVLASTAIEIITNPSLLKEIRSEFDERRGKDFKYLPLLGDRKPPLDYRR